MTQRSLKSICSVGIFIRREHCPVEVEIMLTEKYGLEHERCTEDFPCCRSTVSGLQLLFDSDVSQPSIAGREVRMRCFDGRIGSRHVRLNFKLN